MIGAAPRFAQVWISGLFNPVAFLTAVIQLTARKNNFPLDRMVMQTEVRAGVYGFPSTRNPFGDLADSGIFPFALPPLLSPCFVSFRCQPSPFPPHHVPFFFQ